MPGLSGLAWESFLGFEQYTYGPFYRKTSGAQALHVTKNAQNKKDTATDDFSHLFSFSFVATSCDSLRKKQYPQ